MINKLNDTKLYPLKSMLDNKKPVDNMPITFDLNGVVVSRFSDDYWDFGSIIRGYETSKVLDFSEEGTGLNKETLHHLRLIILYNWLYNRKSKDNVSFRTIINKYHLYKSIAVLFKCGRSSFLNINNNGIVQREYLEKLSLNKGSRLSLVISNIKSINKAGYFFELGDEFGINQEFIAKIEKIKNIAISTTKQTILIPSRIYSEFICSTLEAFQKLKDSLNQLQNYFNEIFPIVTHSRGRSPILFSKIIKNSDLVNYCEYFNIRTNYQMLFNLVLIQVLGVLLVGCLTGMRKSEILNLDKNCLQEKVVEGRSIYVLNGYTSKTTALGMEQTSWITSKLIFPVIDTLIAIHPCIKSICDHYGVYQDISIEEYPLFPHIPIQKVEVKGIHSLYKHPPTMLYSINLAIGLLKNVEIRQDDIDELEQFNPLVNWVDEYGLKPGEIWNFRPHQFRRSLVVYAIRSGMISLAALKKQLKHLSMNMTAYYGNYSGSAKNLFDQTLVNEIKEENYRYQFVQYEQKVIATEDVLFGGEGARLSSLKQIGKSPEYLLDKKKTLQYFQEGRLSYKKTPLGGCSKIGACDKLGFSFITACIDCKNSIFDSTSKAALNKTKKAYLDRLTKYTEESITYRQILIEINSIDKILNKIEILEIKNV